MDSVLSLLIVEDEIDLREIIQLTLDKMPNIGYEVAGSAETALELLQDKSFDAIIVDHYLPGATGVDLLTKVMVEYPKIKRYLMTGAVDQQIYDRAIDSAKVIRVFEKPLILEEIIESVRNDFDQY